MSDAGLFAVDLASGAHRPVATVKAQGYYFTEKPVPVDDMRLSPDGRWIAAQTSEQLYLLPRPPDPAVAVDLTAPANPARKVTDLGADFLARLAEGRRVWTVGHSLQTPTAAQRNELEKGKRGIYTV